MQTSMFRRRHHGTFEERKCATRPMEICRLTFLNADPLPVYFGQLPVHVMPFTMPASNPSEHAFRLAPYRQP